MRRATGRSASRSATPSDAAPPPSSGDASIGASGPIVAAVGLVLLAAARIAATVVPTSATWSLDLARFVLVPSPRVLQQWVTAAMLAGNAESASRALERAVERDPSNPDAWRRLAGVAMRRGDATAAGRALVEILRLAPSDTTARRLLEALPPATPE
jgi:predicted Zn-dependent protease